MDEPDGVFHGGYFSDNEFCFSENTEYILCPCGPRILVIRCASGELVTTLEGDAFHQKSLVLCVERIRDPQYLNHYVSLDSNSTLCIWELKEFSTPECTVSILPHGRLFLCDLQFNSDVYVDSLIKREKIYTILTPPNVNSSMFGTSLILVIACSLSNKELPKQPDLSSEERDSDNSLSCIDEFNPISQHQERSDANKKFIVEVAEMSFRDFLVHLKTDTSEAFDCIPLFYFTPKNHPKKVVPKMKSILKCAMCDSLIVLVKDYSLFVYNRSTKSFLLVTHTNIFSSVTLSSTGRYLVTGDAGGNIVWWRVLEAQQNTTTKDVSVVKTKSSCVKALQTRIPIYRIHGNNLSQVSFHLAYQNINHINYNEEPLLPTGLKYTKEAFEIPVSIQHWHSHPVRTVCFAPSGLHLISAGEEGVLVFWHVSQCSRNFMPRFGAPIHHIVAASGSSSLIAISLADNSLRLIDTVSLTAKSAYFGLLIPLSLLQGGSLQPITLRSRLSDLFPIRIQFFSPKYPMTALIVASGITSDGLGANSRLQIYDMGSNSCLGLMKVNKQNYVSRTDSNLKKYQWTIQNACMAPSGQQLVTAEFRRSMFPSTSHCLKEEKYKVDGSLSVSRGDRVHILRRKTELNHNGENYDENPNTFLPSNQPYHHHHWSGTTHTSGKRYVMKFWSITVLHDGVGISSYLLVTEVTTPHTHDITQLLCLACSNSALYSFLSTSLDGTWKVWCSVVKEQSDKESYVLKHTGSYRTLPCLCASLTKDQSFLAIGHPSCISLWETQTYSMRTVLSVPYSPHTIPLQNCASVTWLVASANELSNTFIGEALLLAHIGHYIILWDLKILHCPRLVWIMKLPDPASTVLIPDIWGFPMFFLYSRKRLSLDIYWVKRDISHEIICDVKHLIDFSSRATLLFSVKCCGNAFYPCLGILDNNLNYTFYPLKRFCDVGKRFSVAQPTLERLQEENNNEENELQNKLCQIDHGNPITSKEESQREIPMLDVTSVLSAFIQDYGSSFIKHSISSKYIDCLIGRSHDYASHLVGTPTTLFNRMTHLYSKKFSSNAAVSL